MQLDLEELSTNHHDFQAQVQCISENLKTATKNELRPFITSKFEDSMHQVQILTTRLENLEKQNKQLQNDNQSLKTQVRTLQANMNKVTKAMTDADTKTQHTAVNASHQVNTPSTSPPTPPPTN
jgi:predicted  nucleic acid-binding Zn-ribbon protein